MDIFSWEHMDFERFTFNTNESPQDVYLKNLHIESDKGAIAYFGEIAWLIK